VPTSKPRYTLTDTGALTEMLDLAERRWPIITDRKALLLQLVTAGAESVRTEVADRQAAIAETAGALSGTYEPGELERLRGDWPE
jgi:hypothetical protein